MWIFYIDTMNFTGREKLCSMPVGGGAAPAAAAVSGGGAAAAEEKKGQYNLFSPFMFIS